MLFIIINYNKNIIQINNNTYISQQKQPKKSAYLQLQLEGGGGVSDICNKLQIENTQKLLRRPLMPVYIVNTVAANTKQVNWL